MNKPAILPESRGTPESGGPRADARPPQVLVGATFLTGAAARAQLPPLGPPEVAFAGRSNAGKSSAINALAHRNRLAYASRTPGRTREINFFTLRNGGRVADLPGYGYAAVAKDLKRSWQDFLWEYVSTRSTLIGLVLVVDARHGLKALDRALLDAFLPTGRPVLVLATKSDKLNRAEQTAAVRRIEGQIAEAYPAHRQRAEVLPFSTTARTGIEAADRVLGTWLAA